MCSQCKSASLQQRRIRIGVFGAAIPDIKWNFTKFLVGRDGKVVKRFEPTAKMGGIDAAIVSVL